MISFKKNILKIINMGDVNRKRKNSIFKIFIMNFFSLVSKKVFHN